MDNTIINGFVGIAFYVYTFIFGYYVLTAVAQVVGEEQVKAILDSIVYAIAITALAFMMIIGGAA